MVSTVWSSLQGVTALSSVRNSSIGVLVGSSTPAMTPGFVLHSFYNTVIVGALMLSQSRFILLFIKEYIVRWSFDLGNIT